MTYNRTCIYKNIYYSKGEWIVINIKQKYLKCVSIGSRLYNYCWKPIIKLKNVQHDKIIKGYSIFIKLFYIRNIGHLLWDDLYSMYVSFIKLNLHLDPFTIIISKKDYIFKNSFISKIFETFSMKRIIYEEEMNNRTFLFDTLIVGVGHQCQRCVNKDYSIAGGKILNGTWWMRKRMYTTYKIKECKSRYAIIVHNKRYTTQEKEVFMNLIKTYKSKLRIVYIDWRNYKSFYDQLQILSCTWLYISGPGTGLLNFPFISDPGIIINLGGLFRGCPFYMEQYMSEGSPHFITLYYPSKVRSRGINENEIHNLLNQSQSIIKNWNIYKLCHSSNLNIEGELLKLLFNKHNNVMNKVLRETDWAKGRVGIWAEKLIYFPKCYNIQYVVPIIEKELIKYNELLGCPISNSTELCD